MNDGWRGEDHWGQQLFCRSVHFTYGLKLECHSEQNKNGAFNRQRVGDQLLSPKCTSYCCHRHHWTSPQKLSTICRSSLKEVLANTILPPTPLSLLLSS